MTRDQKLTALIDALDALANRGPDNFIFARKVVETAIHQNMKITGFVLTSDTGDSMVVGKDYSRWITKGELRGNGS